MREINVILGIVISLPIALFGVFLGYLYNRFVSRDRGKKIIKIAFATPLIIALLFLLLMNAPLIGRMVHDEWKLFSRISTICVLGALSLGTATFIWGVVKKGWAHFH